jgi:hypothetical protein
MNNFISSEDTSIDWSMAVLTRLKFIVESYNFENEKTFNKNNEYLEKINDLINEKYKDDNINNDICEGTNKLIKLVIQMMIGYPIFCMLDSYFKCENDKLYILLITQTGGCRSSHYVWMNNLISNDKACIRHYDESHAEHVFCLDLNDLLRIKSQKLNK